MPLPSPALRPASHHVLLLKWLLLTTAVAVAALLLGHAGLLARVLDADRTGVTVAITVVFLIAAGHGASQVFRLSRVLNHAAELEAWVEAYGRHALRRALSGRDPGWLLPAGAIADHLGQLWRKIELSGGAGLDQAPLNDVFVARLANGRAFGWFVADLLLSLGLLGTVIGFILMLGPIAGLDAGDAQATRDALGAMSGGMAVALYTTLAGLVGSLLLRLQGYLLDRAIDEAHRRATELAELHLVPSALREAGHAA